MENLELLSKVALSFQNTDNFDSDMKEILEYIGNAIDVSRIYIFLNKSEEIVSNIFEWCNENVISQIQNLQEFKYENMPSWRKILEEKGYILSENILNLPQDIINVLQPKKIKSLVVYPMIIEKRIKGFIGFDECRYNRIWTREELKVLSTVSGIVSNAYEKKFFQEELEDKYQKLNNIIEGTNLGTWELDIKKEELLVSKELTNIIGYPSKELKTMNMKKWSSILHPDDLEKTLKSIENHLNGQTDYYACEVRIKHKDGSWIWFEDRGRVTQRDQDGNPLKMFGTLLDINLKKQIDVKIDESEKKFFLALEQTKVGFWDYNIKTKKVFLSSMMNKIMGYKKDELDDSIQAWKRLVHPDYKESLMKEIKNCLDGRSEKCEILQRLKHKDGSWRWILTRGRILKDNKGQADRFIGTNIDVTREYSQRLEIDNFFSVSLDLLCISNIDGKIIKTNKAWKEILGYESEEIKGSSFFDLVHPDDMDKTLKSLDQFGQNIKDIHLINRYKNIDGEYRYIEWRSNPQGDILYSSGRDITDRVYNDRKLIDISNRDALTNIYNRRYIYSKAEEIISQYKLEGSIFSICIIDIDDFKKVNDRYGHQIGDFILKEFTKILSSNIRPGDILGRYGGEEFIIILKNVNEKKSKLVIDRILNTIRNKSFNFGNESIKISFSAGISDCREVEKDKLTIDNLVNIADGRMYRAKNIGKNKIITSRTIGLEV